MGSINIEVLHCDFIKSFTFSYIPGILFISLPQDNFATFFCNFANINTLGAGFLISITLSSSISNMTSETKELKLFPKCNKTDRFFLSTSLARDLISSVSPRN